MRGRIIKGVGGFYYVQAEDGNTYECRARGIFRKDKMKPLPGDDVEISVTSVQDGEGSLDSIAPRRSSLIRPAAANVDQVLIVFAAARPAPNFGLLDRYLIAVRRAGVPAVLCFNKCDLADEETLDRYREIYRGCGTPLLFVSVKEQTGIDLLKERLDGRTTCVAGPSGAGKSSLTNLLCPEAGMEVGEISRKIARGKQTTRHTQLLPLWENTWFLDTPGFGTMDLPDMDYRDLRLMYPEFEKPSADCRFLGCIHVGEPDCGVKKAVADGDISSLRYENYTGLVQELKERRRY